MNLQGGLPCINCYENKNNPRRFGADIGMSIRSSKWDINLAANYLRNDIAGRRAGDASTLINNIYTQFPSNGERSYKRYSYSVRTNITYTINKQNNISAGFLQSEKTQFRTADLFYTNSKKNSVTNNLISNTNYFNQNLVNKYGSFLLGNLDYTHIFLNKSSLIASILYEKALLNGYTNNLNQLTNLNKDSLEFSQNTGRSPLNAYRFKLDYSKDITDGKFEAGIQYRDQFQTGEYLGVQAIIGTNQYLTLPEFSDNITITNRILSGYFQLTQKKSLWEYTLGLRYENANRKFKADKSVNSIPLLQNNFFPNVNILYQIKDHYKLKAAIARRVQRNTNNELNPYFEREHSETLEQGDPYLLPELATTYELGWIKEWDKGSFFQTIYYQDIKNVISRTNNVYNDSIIRRIYTNSGNADLLGMESGLTTKVLSWWQFYFGANLYHYSIKGSLFNNTIIVDNSNWVFSINTNHTIKLSPTINAQFTLNYLSERVTPQGKDSYFFQPNLSLKKTWSNKYLLTMQWQNIAFGNMKTNQQRITTSGRDFFTSTNYIQETNIILINFGININQINKKNKLPVSEFGEREF
jgi:outer membrane receptor protein involved in Fe transport